LNIRFAFLGLIVFVTTLLEGRALCVGHAASQPESLTIGYSSFSGHYVPLWIAIEDHLGKKYGLDLKAVYAGRARPQ
jgi:ABC-type nitrate/sulfonate/bicarbonate transport system substrate-binding protein